MIEIYLGNMVWPLMGGLTLLAAALILFMQFWVLDPINRLVHQLEIMARAEVPSSLKKLPVERKDEVGLIVRAVYRIAAASIRNRHEARQVRRTLDTRVESETRRACIRLQDLAMRDFLTHLGNRRYLDEQLGPLIEAAPMLSVP
jgi:PleD family two-component response regulator